MLFAFGGFPRKSDAGPHRSQPVWPGQLLPLHSCPLRLILFSRYSISYVLFLSLLWLK
ncbi:MAG: hypothetical protein AVDCRST_MAG56-6890 [uncultured Cytophagales bacterium]|uniref:Uncharacterized protein n=1 Tax=uncultured Cytophagales bacterium TaxID=158755 RepID=A0A6J4KZR2_9SPHI|nr:MAG: hypothetical protein AVDCRST_MAG56-6890 [uncultured Cytophagales bacterium]